MRILLVRLRLIGDVVFTTPIISALRHHYPTAHLAYVVEPAAEPIVRANPRLDEIIVAPKRAGLLRLRDDVALGTRLRQARFDVALDLHGGPRSAWLTWASRAPMRIGYAIPGRSWMYTRTVARASGLQPRHSVLNQSDLLQPLGLASWTPERFPVEMAEDPAAAARVESRLRALGIGPQHVLVVMHVSAGNPFRTWPEAYFAQVVQGVTAGDPSSRVLLTAGPSDRAAAERIARRLDATTPGALLPIVADWELADLRALIARAAVYIGGDSGPAHMAATTSTPIIGILGPTLAERSRPWRDARWFTEMLDAGPLPCRPCHQRRCEPGDFRCLSGIRPERVVAAVERALAARRVETR
jgi:lipopolysaccharide heptosyltransferase II